MTTALAERLRNEKGRLARRVVDEMFANPFWSARFATRGRRFAEEDLGYHVDYVVQALVARDAGVLERYARWLQSILTSRGMCTVHLADSFARLDRAIQESVEDGRDAHAHLVAARAALLYRDGPARELQEAAARLGERVVGILHLRHPDWATRWGARGRAFCLEDVGYHLAYLADAIALDRSSLFHAYLGWIDAFLSQRGVGDAHLTRTLDAIGGVVADDPTLSPALRSAVARMLKRSPS